MRLGHGGWEQRHFAETLAGHGQCDSAQITCCSLALSPLLLSFHPTFAGSFLLLLLLSHHTGHSQVRRCFLPWHCPFSLCSQPQCSAHSHCTLFSRVQTGGLRLSSAEGTSHEFTSPAQPLSPKHWPGGPWPSSHSLPSNPRKRDSGSYAPS